MKVLNLYAGIGGNRKLWEGVDVTAVEYNEEIAMIYKDYFPDDTVVVGDAHQYLLDHYKEFDFIWSSPPCQTHSDMKRMGIQAGLHQPVFIDTKLWQEIIFLKHISKALFVVENVVPFYEPFVAPTLRLQRHLFWTNLNMRPAVFEDTGFDIRRTNTVLFGYDLSKYKIKHRKAQILRNCVNPELGLHFLNAAKGIESIQATNQQSLFQ